MLGISPLADSLDLVNSVPVDYMHPVLEGVTRVLINLWFKSSNHRSPFYLGNKISEIDAVLLKQRPPHEISRRPRSILHTNYWESIRVKKLASVLFSSSSSRMSSTSLLAPLCSFRVCCAHSPSRENKFGSN